VRDGVDAAVWICLIVLGVALHFSCEADAAAGPRRFVTLSCRGRSEAAPSLSPAPRDVAFEAKIFTDDGDLLGIVDEESGKVQALAYDAEISLGSLKFENQSEVQAFWTRGKNNGGDFVGEAIGANGEITAVRIMSKINAAAGSEFVLFDTEREETFKGICH